MSDVIKLLPDSVANQIAAGEVIQRPAAVIKELVENAVDAGASIIKIIIKDAGRTLIQVVDNGCGMSATDARMAFERHSTSKISNASDLFSLHTMGFRGEALASICAISQVELRTMRKDDSVGTRIIIEGSHVVSQEPDAGVPGSNMMVKNLFYNVPARRKFLKSDQVEMNHILREFERMALVNPHIEFQLTNNGTVMHQLLPGSFKQRIVDLFGKSMDRQLVPVETDTSLVRITGFVCNPENARKRGFLQYFMVNGRNMRHPYFHKAVMSCYEDLIPADEQPNYFLNFTVNPEAIDVNIHPTKSEIKFEDEQPIWKILVAAIKEGLSKFNVVPTIEFDMDNAPDIPTFNPDVHASHGLDLDNNYNPFENRYEPVSKPPTTYKQASSVPNDWEKLYEDFARNRDESFAGMKESSLNSLDVDDDNTPADDFNSIPDFDIASHSNAMQLKGRYLLTPAKSGLMIVDQQRAHIRILYERFLELARNNALCTQRIIFPEVIELSSSQSSVLESISDEVAKLGFDISFLGDNNWTINGLPSVINDANPREMLLSMIDCVSETGAELGDDIYSRIALSMARAAAIKPGQSLSQDEIDRILSDLFKLQMSNYTPDGKTIVTIISNEDIARLFA